MSVNLRLKIRFPWGEEKSIPFRGRELVLGRDPSCDIVVNDPEVSRKHATLLYEDLDKVSLMDTGSMNGTLVRGEPISEKTILTPGTCFQIGETYVTLDAPGQDSVDTFHADIPDKLFTTWKPIQDQPTKKSDDKSHSMLMLQHDLLEGHAGLEGLETLLMRIANILDAENGIIQIFEDDSLSSQAVRVVRTTKLNYPSNVLEKVVSTGNSILIKKTDDHAKKVLKPNTIGSILCAPIRDQETSWGGVYFDRGVNRETLGDDDFRKLVHICHLVAISFRRHHDFDLMRKERDSLRAERDRWFIMINEESDLPVKSNNRKYQQLLFKVLRIANTNHPTLLIGPIGTGKSTLAKRIHFSSPRQENAFIEINCAQIPHDLLEERLWGREQPGDRINEPTQMGLIEMANNGTLYLREISALPHSIQSKICEILETEKMVRMGGVTPIPVDIRLIASTDVEPSRMINAETFIQKLVDLFQNMVLEVPTLHKRMEDIIPLSKYFLRLFLPSNRPVPELSDEVTTMLNNYNWPGNITELRRTMRYVASVCNDRHVEIGDLPRVFLEQPSFSGSSEMTLREQMDLFEMEIIRSALERNKQIVTRAAKELGLSESTLRYRMQRLAL